MYHAINSTESNLKMLVVVQGQMLQEEGSGRGGGQEGASLQMLGLYTDVFDEACDAQTV